MRATNWIIVACILSSILAWLFSPIEYEFIFNYLIFSTENILQGRIWTLVTALFVHYDWLHLGSNMLFLFIFGNTLEEELGKNKIFLAFFFGGIMSFLLSSFFYDSRTAMLGASGAIFTLTSIVMLVKPLKFSFSFFMPLGLVAIIYFLYNMAAIYFEIQSNVSFMSHVIGFIVGIPFGISWSKDWVRHLLITICLLILYYGLQILLVQVFS
jgi:membrane associated rhomboid family serine protease